MNSHRIQPRNNRTEKSKTRAVIFDIGRVIVRLEPKRALAIFNDGVAKKNAHSRKDAAIDPDQIWLAIQDDPMWHDWQEGRASAREWHANVCKRFGLKVGFEDFCRAWNSVMLPEPILPDRLFARLAQRAKLLLLSNTDEIHVAHMESAFTFPRYFDARIYSNQVHASKPGRAIFRAALRAAGTEPEETLFIDDVKKYVLAARKMGMDGIVFRNRRQLEGELRKRKLM